MTTTLFKMASILLSYPEAGLLEALDDIRAELNQSTHPSAMLQPVLQHLEGGDLITLQENYVQTFDRNPSHSLHLFEHIHGEDRARGQAMVDLLEEYKKYGFEPVCAELPDYVPLLLEFLAQCPPHEANRILGDAVHVLAHIGGKLRNNSSPYACVLELLVWLSPIAPQPLTEPPIRDMDDMLETFGPDASGTEPLLRPARPEVVAINFYPHRPGA